MTKSTSFAAIVVAAFAANVSAFTQPTAFVAKGGFVKNQIANINTHVPSTTHQMSSFDDDFLQETPDQTRERIQDLVDQNPVLLFMKGSKIFPQCGFSSTAVQILNTFGIDFQSGLWKSFSYKGLFM